MCKYHTVFLTQDGVFTCGHGQGGRLGHPTEETCLVSCCHKYFDLIDKFLENWFLNDNLIY